MSVAIEKRVNVSCRWFRAPSILFLQIGRNVLVGAIGELEYILKMEIIFLLPGLSLASIISYHRGESKRLRRKMGQVGDQRNWWFRYRFPTIQYMIYLFPSSADLIRSISDPRIEIVEHRY